jgi:hypothetical protein
VSGAVAIGYGRSANRLIAGKEVVLIPGLNESNQLQWICGHAEPPPGLTMAITNYTTSIPDQYLPAACRGIR